MKWLTAAIGLTVVISASGCWRPYYGRNYAQPALSQPPAFGQPTYQQPVAQQQVIAQPQVMQAAPMVQQCQPCQPAPTYCVPCY